MRECLTEDELLVIVAGHVEPSQMEHIAACDSCASVVAYLVGQHSPAAEKKGPSASPPSGSTPLLVGRYELLGLAGAGAMARVYAAWDPERGVKVALKLLLPSASAVPRLEERLRREAEALGRLNHPNVVAVYEAGRSDLGLFLAMEFVEGQTLHSWLRLRSRPWRQVLGAFVQAGQGLAAAHRASIIHRDFKPQNVLVSADDRVLVADFGLCRVGGASPHSPSSPPEHAANRVALTQDGALVGTPAYMAPEQFASGLADRRSDVFSFCVALYEGLWRVRPFPLDFTIARMPAITHESARQPPDDEVPQTVKQAVMAGLSADPNQRPADMGELLTRLTWPRQT